MGEVQQFRTVLLSRESPNSLHHRYLRCVQAQSLQIFTKHSSERLLRIRIIQKPKSGDVDGIRLDLFEPGVHYEVGNQLGALMLAEGWAAPVDLDQPVVFAPVSELSVDVSTPSPKNLTREFFPPYYDSGTALAADRRRRSRTR
jgi:hypothetical protein